LAVTAIGANASVLMETNATLINTTIIRTRGLLTTLPQVFSADLNIIGAFGIGIVSDQAAAAGAASIPGPWTDKDWDGWFVWLPFSWRFEVTDDVGRLIASVSTEIDSKAMRKVGANETVVVMAESQGAALNVSNPFRMLVKLS